MRLHRTGFIRMSNVNKNVTVEAKLISPPTYIYNPHLRLNIATEWLPLLYFVGVPQVQRWAFLFQFIMVSPVIPSYCELAGPTLK